MKKIFLIFFLVFFFAANSQTKNSTIIILPEDTTIYVRADSMPEFPGGISAMIKFIQNSIEYPPAEICSMGTGGKCFVEFVVNKEGAVQDVKVIKKSPSRVQDIEAVRVVKTLPKFKPGKKNGKAVNVRMQIPVKFELQ